MTTPTCPRCGGRFEEGYVLDQGDHGSRNRAAWIEGPAGAVILGRTEAARQGALPDRHPPLLPMRLPGVVCAKTVIAMPRGCSPSS